MIYYQFIWCGGVQVQNLLRKIRLSPAWAIILVVSTILCEAKAASAERVTEDIIINAQATEVEPPVQTTPSTDTQPESPAQQTPPDGQQAPDSTSPQQAPPDGQQAPDSTSPQQTPPDGQQAPDSTSPQQAPPDGQQAPDSSSETEPRVLVGEVQVNGAEGELQDIVYRTINTEPGRTTTRSQLQEDVNAIYATGYFANVRVIPEDTPLGVRITFDVKPNPVLSQVEIQTIPENQQAPKVPQEEINRIFGDGYGKVLNLRDLQADIKELDQWYTDQGYDLAQVVGAPQVTEDGKVTLIVAEGVIEDVQVRFYNEENEAVKGRTRDFIVTREIQLKSGDIFNRKTAQRDLQRVFGLGIFEDVRLSFSPGQDPSKVIVNVDIVENKTTGALSAGGGFSSESGFFGEASYRQENLGGNNQTLATLLQIGERQFVFDASFTDPWIGGDPFRTSYTLNAFRRQNLSLVFSGEGGDIVTLNGFNRPRVVRTGGRVVFSRPLAKDVFSRPDWLLSAGFQYQRVGIENADGDIAPISREGTKLSISDSGEDDLFLFTFGATSDRRNNPTQPTSGSLLRLGLDQTVPLGSGTILFTRLRGSYSYYIPLKLIGLTDKPETIALNVQAGAAIGDLPPYEAFIIGGPNSVRGYADGTVGNGRSYVITSAEYRVPIFSFIGAALFFDYGTNLGTGDSIEGRPSIIRGLPGSGFGYGIGLRIQSPLGPLRVDYAINDEGEDRIQFGIGERF
jgi:outer membrane protein insertion porin family